MNAISPPNPETAEQRTVRQLGMCRELAELSMALARAAARQAEQDLAAPKSPGESAAVPPRGTDPRLLFLRLSTAVRQAIALESRITASHNPPARSKATDPRREIFAQMFHNVTEHYPDRGEIRRAGLELLDDEIARDPEGQVPVSHLFTLICQDLRIPEDGTGRPDPNDDLDLPDANWIPPSQRHRTNPPSPTKITSFRSSFRVG